MYCNYLPCEAQFETIVSYVRVHRLYGLTCRVGELSHKCFVHKLADYSELKHLDHSHAYVILLCTIVRQKST